MLESSKFDCPILSELNFLTCQRFPMKFSGNYHNILFNYSVQFYLITFKIDWFIFKTKRVPVQLRHSVYIGTNKNMGWPSLCWHTWPEKIPLMEFLIRHRQLPLFKWRLVSMYIQDLDIREYCGDQSWLDWFFISSWIFLGILPNLKMMPIYGIMIGMLACMSLVQSNICMISMISLW